MLGKICLLFLGLTLLLASESFAASLLSSHVTAGQAEPKLSFTSNVTSVAKDDHFTLTCKVANFNPTNRFYMVYFYRNDSFLDFGGFTVYPESDHHVDPHVQVFDDRGLGFQVLSSAFPVYEISLKGRQTYEYFCRLSGYKRLLVNSNHVNITVI